MKISTKCIFIFISYILLLNHLDEPIGWYKLFFFYHMINNFQQTHTHTQKTTKIITQFYLLNHLSVKLSCCCLIKSARDCRFKDLKIYGRVE